MNFSGFSQSVIPFLDEDTSGKIYLISPDNYHPDFDKINTKIISNSVKLKKQFLPSKQ
jgi:hypothetical protein